MNVRPNSSYLDWDNNGTVLHVSDEADGSFTFRVAFAKTDSVSVAVGVRVSPKDIPRLREMIHE